jgi:hypothetical protein
MTATHIGVSCEVRTNYLKLATMLSIAIPHSQTSVDVSRDDWKVPEKARTPEGPPQNI